MRHAKRALQTSPVETLLRFFKVPLPRLDFMRRPGKAGFWMHYSQKTLLQLLRRAEQEHKRLLAELTSDDGTKQNLDAAIKQLRRMIQRHSVRETMARYCFPAKCVYSKCGKTYFSVLPAIPGLDPYCCADHALLANPKSK